MTTLTTRNEIVQTKKIIKSELTKIQKAFYDEEILKYYKDDNEEHLYRDQFDLYNNEVVEYKTYNKIIGFSHSDINTFTTELTNKLTRLFQKIGVTEFHILSHLKLDFFGNRGNSYEPLVNAYQQLEEIVGQSTYKEAFTIDIKELNTFLDILFWTTRCDPSVAEYIFLFDKDEKISIHLCRFGNIHLTEFGNETLTDKTLTSLGWKIIEGQEFDNFSSNEKIEGRELKM